MKHLALAIFLILSAPSFVYAANIDATNKYARFLNTGTLINFGATNGNVIVTSTTVTGYAWSAAAGWINLAPTNGGVVNDGNGVLSGYAWGENTGWINFKPTSGGVTIDASGNFSGYAWSESRGWIVFNCATDSSCGTLSHKVQTSWIPASATTAGSLGSGWVNTVNSQIPQPVPQGSAEPSTPTSPGDSDTGLPQPQIPEQSPDTTPLGASGTNLNDTTQPDVQVGAGLPNDVGATEEGGATGVSNVTDSVRSSSPTIQDNIFAFATKATGVASVLLSNAKDFSVKSLQKIRGVLSAPVVGSVTVLSLAATGVVAIILLFVLSRMKSIFLKSTSSISSALFSLWGSLTALLAAKRRTPEKSSEVLNREEATPIFIEPQVSPAQIEVVKNVEKDISWNIQPQPVVLPTNNTHEILQEPALEEAMIEPEVVVSREEKKEAPITEASIKEKIFSDNRKSSIKDFANLFMRRNPVEQLETHEQKLEIKAEAPKENETAALILLPLENAAPQEVPKTITETVAATPAVIVEKPAQTIVTNNSTLGSPLKKEENTKHKNPFRKIGTKIAEHVAQLSRKMSKMIPRISKEMKPTDDVKKHVWNSRPPTGTD